MTQSLAPTAERPTALPQEAYLDPKYVERSLELTLAFNRALIEDPELRANVPNGVTVVLLPEDAEGDAEFVELSIALGLEAIREGRNVLFHHMPPTEPDAR